MSYDLQMFKPVPGVDPLDITEMDEDELPALAPEQVTRAIDELKRLNGNFELVEDEEDVRELTDPETGLDIAIYPTSASLSFPDDAEDEELESLIELANDCLQVLAEELGVLIFDPQREEMVDPAKGIIVDEEDDEDEEEDLDFEENKES